LQLPVAAPARRRTGLGGVAVSLAAEPDTRFDHVVGLGATEDLAGHVGQEGVHAMALGTDLDPAGEGVGDPLTRAVAVAHRRPLSRWTTDPFGVTVALIAAPVSGSARSPCDLGRRTGERLRDRARWSVLGAAPTVAASTAMVVRRDGRARCRNWARCRRREGTAG